MKTLKFKFDLDCKVAVYVPSTMDVNNHCDNTTFVKDTIKQLSLLFGGATATNAVGGWVSATGETVIEAVTIVYLFCSSEGLKEHFSDVLAICEQIKSAMKQEAVTLEVNGQVKFV